MRLELAGEYESRELCELIHLEGADTLAVYGDDFYAGRPALTVNSFGKGKAYYIASRLDDEFLKPFYKQVLAQARIEAVLHTVLPAEVTAQVRTDGENEYIFLMNFGQQTQTVELDAKTYWDMMSQETLEASSLRLEPYGVRVLKRSK